MKKLIFGIAVLAVAYGCNKINNNDDAPAQKSVVGHWNYVKDSVNFYNSGKYSSNTVIKYASAYMEFNADGTGRNAETTFTYSVVGNTLTIKKDAYNDGSVQHFAETTSGVVQEITDKKIIYILRFYCFGQ